jgi:hypothetical protein
MAFGHDRVADSLQMIVSEGNFAALAWSPIEHLARLSGENLLQRTHRNLLQCILVSH